MKVNQETVRHLADLSNFALDEATGQKLETNLNDIIGYISQLDELDTEGVEPTYQVFEMENIWRSDEIQTQEANREQLLNLTKATENHQIKVPKVL